MTTTAGAWGALEDRRHRLPLPFALAEDWEGEWERLTRELLAGLGKTEDEAEGRGVPRNAVEEDLFNYARIVRHNFGRERSDGLYRVRLPAFGGDLVAVVRVRCAIDDVPGLANRRVRVPGLASALKRAGMLFADTHTTEIGNALLDLRAVLDTVRASIRLVLKERSAAGGYTGLQRVRLELMEGVWQTIAARLLSRTEPARVDQLALEFCTCFFFVPLASELVPPDAEHSVAQVLAALRALPGCPGGELLPLEAELLGKACGCRNRRPITLPVGAELPPCVDDETIPLLPMP